MLSQTQSADEVFARFCKLDAQGGQLTPDGWRKIAALFLNPGPPRLDRIIVSDGGGPLRSTPGAGKIAVGREYIEYGQIDLPQLAFPRCMGTRLGSKCLRISTWCRRPVPAGSLSPLQEIVRLYFGIGCERSHSASEIAREFQVSSQVIGGILAGAQRRLAKVGLTPCQLAEAACRDHGSGVARRRVEPPARPECRIASKL